MVTLAPTVFSMQAVTIIAVPQAGSYTVSLKLGAPDYTYSIVRNSFDKRAMFWTDGQTLDINDISNFNDGWAITKWKNVTKAGVAGKDPHLC
jgi:hypothetical protein